MKVGQKYKFTKEFIAWNDRFCPKLSDRYNEQAIVTITDVYNDDEYNYVRFFVTVNKQRFPLDGCNPSILECLDCSNKPNHPCTNIFV